MRKWIFSTIIGLAFAANALAFTVPTLDGRVTDTAHLLSPVVKEKLVNELKTLEDQTTAQMAILTVPDLQGMEVRDYGIKVAEAWHLGTKDQDNGVLFVYSVAEDKAAIEVGYGLEGALPDSLVKRIGVSYFRPSVDRKKGKSDYDTGFSLVTAEVAGIISAEFAKDPTGKSLSGADGMAVLLMVFAGAVIILLVLICFSKVGDVRYGSGFGGGGSWSGSSGGSSWSSRSSGRSSFGGGGGSFGGGGSDF